MVSDRLTEIEARLADNTYAYLMSPAPSDIEWLMGELRQERIRGENGKQFLVQLTAMAEKVETVEGGVKKLLEALTLIADYGHEMDDYEMTPKEARRIARAALRF